MATKQRKSKRLTLADVGVVRIEVHALTAIPIGNGANRWQFANWDEAYRAVERGEAISIPCEPDEVNVVLVNVRERFAQEDAGQPLDHQYEPDTKRLWVWGGCSMDQFLRRASAAS